MLLLGRLRLKCFYNAVFGFLSVLYVLSVYFTTVARKTFLNVFYNVLLELVLILAVSGAGSALPQLFPVRSRVIPGELCCLVLVLPDHAGRRGFIDSRWRSVTDRLKVPGMAPRGTKAPRKCTASRKQHQNRAGLNWKNLKKIAEI